MVRKDEVVEWFQKQSGAGRLDTMCTLLDMCLPFEIRFLGSVMENLGRRDFHELNGVSHSANGFLSGKNTANCTTASAKEALYTVLVNSSGVTSQTSVNPSGTTTTSVPFFPNKDVSSNSPATFSGSDISHEITKDSIQKVSSSSHLPQTTKPPQGQGAVTRDEKSFCSSMNGEERYVETSWKASNVDKPLMFLDDSKNPSPVLDKSILEDETLRRRLILYLSLLTATNRECANAYYKVLLDSQKFLDTPGWLAGLSSDTLEEYCLLFTIALYHPVFTFEQKIILSGILQKFDAHSQLVQRNMDDEEAKFYAAPVQWFIGGFDPKYGPFYMPAVGWSPSANMNIGGNPCGEEMRRVAPNTAPANSMNFTVPHFSPFPMFLQAHHPQGNRSVASQQQTPAPVPHQFPPPQTFSAHSLLSPQSSIGVGPTTFPQPCVYQTPVVIPQSAASHNHIPLGQVVPPAFSLATNEGSGALVPPGPSATGIGGAFTLSLSNKSPSLPQLSQQAMGTVNVSCRSNSSTGLTSNTASNAHTNVHVRDSSVGGGVNDNDSEENYESTEDSPYGSPPQSLTPSRSHSPLSHSNLPRSQISGTNFVNSDTLNQQDHHRPSALPMSGHQGPSKRSVSSASTSISPPPRLNRNPASTKISQVVQVQSPKLNSYNVEAAISCLDHGKSHKSDILPSASHPLAFPGGAIPAVSYAKVQDNQVPLSLSGTINGMKIEETKRLLQYPCKPEYMVPGSGTLQSNTQFSNGQGHDSATPFQSSHSGRRHQMNNHTSNNSAQRRPMPISHVTCTSGQYFPQTSPPLSIHSVQVPKIGNIQAPQPYNVYTPSATPVYYTPQSTKSTLQHQQGPKQNMTNIQTGRLNTTQANGCKLESPNCVQEIKSGTGISLSPAVSVGNPSSSGSSPLNGLNGSDHTQPPCVFPSSSTISYEPSPTTKASATLPNHAASCSSGIPRNRYILDIGGGQELRMEPTSQFFGAVEDIVEGLNRPKKSCYNCGSSTHVGTDCREKTMEDMTKGIYRINFESSEPTVIAEKQKE